MTEFDDVNTNTVRTSEHSIDQIASMVSNGTQITCDTLVVETSEGAFQVTPYQGGLGIWECDDE